MAGKTRNSSPVISMVDLFCGAGGLSFGLQQAGLTPIHAIDCFEQAVSTYRSQIGPHAELERISETTELPNATVFAGGPPCQGFSSAGLRRSGDERNSLVKVYADLVARHKPTAFIFENVEGFLTTEGGVRVLDLLTPLIEVGYRIHLRKVNAANYGVPQHRKRVIAMGGLGWDPIFPEPTHFAHGAPGAERVARHLPPTPTLLESIRDLPPPGVHADDAPIADHHTRPLRGMDLERAVHLEPGQRMGDLPELLQHASFTRRANRRVMDGTPTDRRGGAPSGVRRLRPDEPSKAITAAARSEFIHPSENRTLTLRECARLQTFPDTFVFDGSLGHKAIQIGNAVPPTLAYQIGLALRAGLESRPGGNRPGKLLSFVPTVADAMSPALEHTVQMIRTRFEFKSPSGKQLQLWQ